MQRREKACFSPGSFARNNRIGILPYNTFLILEKKRKEVKENCCERNASTHRTFSFALLLFQTPCIICGSDPVQFSHYGEYSTGQLH
jgi:hypothetical protein